MSKKQKLLILGLGGFAASMVDVASDTSKFDVLGFVVDTPPFERGSTLADKPIYWIDELEAMDKDCLAICALASARRINLINKVQSYGFRFTNLIHPNAYLAHTAKIGLDVIVNCGAQISSNTTIGDHVIINRGVLIGHDAMIKDLAYVSPGVNIAGNVLINHSTYIGMGAIILENISIGEGAFIAAGSLVTQDVPDHVKVIGAPARIIEREFKAL